MTDSPAPKPVQSLPLSVGTALLAGPSLGPELRHALALRVARIMIPAYATLAVAASIATALNGLAWSEPIRMVPAMSVVVASPIAYWVHRDRPRLAVLILLVATLLGATVGLSLMGANAPILFAGLVVLPIVVPLWGTRGGLILTAIVGGAGLVAAIAETAGWMQPSSHWPPLGMAALVLMFLLCAVVFLAGTTNLLSTALATANEQRQRAEQAHAARMAADDAFQAIFDQTAALLFVLSPDGTLQRMNQVARAELGEGADAAIGAPVTDAAWWSAAEREQLTQAIDNAQAGSTASIEFALEDSSAQPRVFSANISPFRAQDGSVPMLILEMVDVTELMDTRQQLEHARRLESLGQLAGGVAHDFNNMLGAIFVASETLGQAPEIQQDDNKRELLRIIDGAADRAADLTRKLLAFGRKDRFANSEVQVDSLLAETCRLLERTLGRQIVVVADIETEGDVVLGDGSALEHAIVNLAVNARDAMPNGGTIVISSRRVDLDHAWCSTLSGNIEPGRCLRITVSDDGEGIPADVLPHIFEPFFTTKPHGTGTGLGLAAVDGTVRSHMGGISVFSEPGQGTAFHIYLPLVPGLVQDSPADDTIEDLVILRGTVLLVDDEPLMRRSIGGLLKASGLTVRVAHDGEGALRLLQHTDVDLVLTNLVMPGVDGLTLALELDHRRPRLPIVLMSGFPRTDVPSTLPSGRALPLLRKPFQRRELLSALRQYDALTPLSLITRRSQG